MVGFVQGDVDCIDLFVDRWIIHDDDLAVILDCVWDQYVVAVDFRQLSGHAGLAVTCRAIQKNRFVGYERRSQLIQEIFRQNKVGENVLKEFLIELGGGGLFANHLEIAVD